MRDQGSRDPRKSINLNTDIKKLVTTQSEIDEEQDDDEQLQLWSEMSELVRETKEHLQQASDKQQQMEQMMQRMKGQRSEDGSKTSNNSTRPNSSSSSNSSSRSNIYNNANRFNSSNIQPMQRHVLPESAAKRPQLAGARPCDGPPATRSSTTRRASGSH